MNLSLLVVNVLRSFIFDIKYFFSSSLRVRAGLDNYAAFRSAKLYPDYLKIGAALQAVIPLAIKHCKGCGIDVGAGRWPLPGARPVEDGIDENAYILKEKDLSLDFLFSSHTLEHLERPWDALGEWTRVLKPEGVLFLYLPHPACEMWMPDNLKYHKWSPDPLTLENRLVHDYGYDILYITYLPDAFFSFVIVAVKRGKK